MRFKLFSVFAVLLLVGSNDARPSKNANPETVEEESLATGSKDDSSWRPIEPTSSTSAVESDSRAISPTDLRELKDLQSMDQSLRTVATQLLNVSNPEETTNGKDRPKIIKGELPSNVLLLRKPLTKPPTSMSGNQHNFDSKTKSDMELVKEINSEISSLESMGIGFGRPTNSKFGYFESSHPGQAMAMTEEELEREMMSSSTRLMTAHKNHPTTTGGISTWILLNSPTTMSTPLKDYNNNDEQMNVQVRLQTKVSSPVKIFETTLKTDMKTMSTEEKTTLMESTTPMEKVVTLTKSTTPIQKKTTVAVRPTTTTEKPVRTTQKTKTAETTTRSSTTLSGSTKNDVKVTSAKPIVMTKKTAVSSRPTPKLRITTPKPANVTSKPMTTKLGRPNQKTKTTTSGKPTTKLAAASSTKNPSTSKIEKVTFRPVQMITTPKSLIESVERPTYVTKIKTSFVADSNTKTTAASQTVTMNTVLTSEDVKSNFSDGDLVEIAMKPKPQSTKTNNVLKVQLKKPTEPPTKIEIEPIKVNAPILTIEKIEDKEKVTKKDVVKTSTPTILDNSRIDLKFDFNPELTRIDVETSTDIAPSTTTKRPHKKKKNKVRRRKPTTVAPTSVATSAATQESISPSTVVTTTSTEEQQNHDILTVLGIADNSIQESKVVPESKISSNNTKNKKKQAIKPIGTQIYNFLSREVMPSFGVMSLVGLGLGLASYFLYPFSGVIARRNYVVEPNYKYNLDEYGGNYGQNEEEVFSKVLQGMTNNDGKYGGIKDYENNFYRYQHFDGAYTAPQSTRKGDPRYPTSSATFYRPVDTTVYDTKYRDTEFKYPDLPTTPNYYERHKQEFVAKKPGHGDRQFVVGNVPKEYGFSDKGHDNYSPTTQTVRGPEFQREIIAQNHKFVKNPVEISPTYEKPEAQALKANEGYEEIEITPAAVAVEHGPRSLNSDLPRLRRKRESVIQLIPSRTEIEKEEEEIEKEEPLSNEILDIIDSVIPENMIGVRPIVNTHKEKHDAKKQEVEKKVVLNDDSKQANGKTNEISETITQAAVETTATAAIDDKATPASTLTITDSATTTTTTTVPTLTIDEILGTTANSNGKDPEDSSVEWFDQSTTEKPHDEPFNIFSFVKKIAEIKLRLGIAILKHASEGFARYLGHVQKRVNGEE